MIDFVMSIMTNCLLLELPERCKPRHAFLVERNECLVLTSSALRGRLNWWLIVPVASQADAVMGCHS